MLENYLVGRQLLKKEIPRKYWKKLKYSEKIQKYPAMKEKGRYIICTRCSHASKKFDVKLSGRKKDIYYCEYCINLLRVESDAYLYTMKTPKLCTREVLFSWQGSLTNRQQKVSDELLVAYQHNQSHLVSAVTGAGKTEMLFNLIHRALEDGKRVGLATPRIDVCLELYPRLTKAFEKEDIALLYGGTEKKFKMQKFVICTTHQLLRFIRYFDVLIIDEADAFPFDRSKELLYASKRAITKDGMHIYLTATPTKSLEDLVLKKELTQSVLSRRFHGYDLPVPKLIYCSNLSMKLRQQKYPKSLLNVMEDKNSTYIIFFPNIKLMKQVFTQLKNKYPNKKMAYVYAGKEDREEIVIKMRQGVWECLFTTTILERGVTFSNISVVVVCADHKVFTTSSLVQIAGRAGRDKNYPDGKVIFIHEGKTREMKEAIKKIKEKNDMDKT